MNNPPLKIVNEGTVRIVPAVSGNTGSAGLVDGLIGGMFRKAVKWETD